MRVARPPALSWASGVECRLGRRRRVGEHARGGAVREARGQRAASCGRSGSHGTASSAAAEPDAVVVAFDQLVTALAAAALTSPDAFERAAAFRQAALSGRGRWIAGEPAGRKRATPAAEG